jgi:hypothetical protein
MSEKLTCIWQGVEIIVEIFQAFYEVDLETFALSPKVNVFILFIFIFLVDNISFFVLVDPYNNNYIILISIVFVYFFGDLECVGHSFDYVTHFVFLRYVWIQTQRPAVASRRAFILTQPPVSLIYNGDINKLFKLRLLLLFFSRRGSWPTERGKILAGIHETRNQMLIELRIRC